MPQNSKYASSIATVEDVPFTILSTSERGIGLPVGLFGLQRKISVVFGVTAPRIWSEVIEKSSASLRTYLTRAPMSSTTTLNIE